MPSRETLRIGSERTVAAASDCGFDADELNCISLIDRAYFSLALLDWDASQGYYSPVMRQLDIIATALMCRKTPQSAMRFSAAIAITQSAMRCNGPTMTNQTTMQASSDAPANIARQRNLAAACESGMDADEVACWEITCDLAEALLKLPKLHPMEAAEYASAIREIQARLFSRPTYRKYLQGHRRLAESNS